MIDDKVNSDMKTFSLRFTAALLAVLLGVQPVIGESFQFSGAVAISSCAQTSPDFATEAVVQALLLGMRNSLQARLSARWKKKAGNLYAGPDKINQQSASSLKLLIRSMAFSFTAIGHLLEAQERKAGAAALPWVIVPVLGVGLAVFFIALGVLYGWQRWTVSQFDKGYDVSIQPLQILKADEIFPESVWKAWSLPEVAAIKTAITVVKKGFRGQAAV